MKTSKTKKPRSHVRKSSAGGADQGSPRSQGMTGAPDGGMDRRPEPAGTGGGRYVVIGLGGIGGLVLQLLTQFLHSLGVRATVLAIDGDAFEERNRARMRFGRPGPKAVVLAEEVSEIYGDRVTVLPVPRYLTPRNAPVLIGEGDVVFCQPDNHATRRIVERRCARLRNVSLFAGGNDGVENGKTGTYGNVQVYLRQRGRDVTNPLSRFHPEIARPADRVPTAQGCAAMLASAPQLLFTNATVAAAMLNAFYAWRLGKVGFEELYLDILTGRMVPVQRRVGGLPARPARGQVVAAGRSRPAGRRRGANGRVGVSNSR